VSREIMPAWRGLRVRPRPDSDAVLVPVTGPGFPDGAHGPSHPQAPGRTTPQLAVIDPFVRGPLSLDARPPGPHQLELLPNDQAPVRAAPGHGVPIDAVPLDGPASAEPPPPRRSLQRLGVAAVAVASLGIGVLGGSGYAQQTARHQREADTRVLLWVDGAQVPGEAQPGAPVVLRVNLIVTGAPLVLDRVMLGAGEGDSLGGVTLLPGRQAAADLALRPDCAAAARSGAGRVEPAAHLRAVVRAAGSARTREVPLDVLADPSALWMSLLAPCAGDLEEESAREAAAEVTAAESTAAGGAGSAGAGAAGPSPALTVSGLTADPSGRLRFALHLRGAAAARFTMPLAMVSGSRARFRLRSRPTLPIIVRPGATVRVTVSVTATCPGHTGALPSTYGLLLPQAGSVAPGWGRAAAGASAAETSVPLEGWDDGVAAMALTAAVLHGCR
jgi:hypothetical protein